MHDPADLYGRNPVFTKKSSMNCPTNNGQFIKKANDC